MLKKITADQLKLGMYVHKLCETWTNSPFWRSSFTLNDLNDIALIIDSDIKEVIIDTAKGLDVDLLITELPLPTENENTLTVSPITEVEKKRTASNKRKEWEQAKAICSESKAAVESMYLDARLGRAVDKQAADQVVDAIMSSSLSCCDSLINIARIKTSDNYTYMHSVAVCAMMISLARQLGLNDEEVNQAGISGLLHDLGKALMPINVLNKPGKLTDEEFAIIKTHPAEGYNLLKNSNQVDPIVLDVILHHHEKYDGSGYPNGLKGEGINLFSRMAAVCDVYDAVTSNRPYKDGWEPAQSLKLMVSWVGHFDPKILQAFIKSIGIYPVGSLVLLESGKLGVVIEQNTGKLLTPIVKVFYSTRLKSPINIEKINLSLPGCKDRIVSLEEAAKWQFNNLNDLCTPD